MAIENATVSLHPLDWLIENSRMATETVKLPETRTWSTASLLPTLSSTPFATYMVEDSQVQLHLTSLIKNGIAFIVNVPVEKKEGHATSLKEVVERISSLRKTWYGDLWDVKAEEGSKNIAYTNLDLGLHMDLTYVTATVFDSDLMHSSQSL